MKLRKQCGLDAVTGFVAGPELVAKRFDHVIGGDADVGPALLDQLEHRVQDAVDRAEWTVLALVEAAQAVEVAEQLVSAIDEVNDHGRYVIPTRALRLWTGLRRLAHYRGLCGHEANDGAVR